MRRVRVGPYRFICAMPAHGVRRNPVCMETPASRSPLKWDHEFMQNMTERMVKENLAPCYRDLAMRYMRDVEFGYSTACSGAEAPSWSFAGIEAFGRKERLNVSCPSLVAAGIVAAKRAWILDMCSADQVYGNMFDILAPSPKCCRTGSCDAPDGRRRTKSWLIGFSCTTVSGINAKKSITCVSDAVGQTGLTFYGAVAILTNKQPATFIKMLQQG